MNVIWGSVLIMYLTTMTACKGIKHPAFGSWMTAEQRSSAKVEVPGAQTFIIHHPLALTLQSTSQAAQLVDVLAHQFRCPSTHASIGAKDGDQLSNCSQEEFKEWLLKCLAEDEKTGVSAVNQTAKVILRTAALGLKCRHPVTCQWPQCQTYDAGYLIAGLHNSINQMFEEEIVESIQNVINESGTSFHCEKVTSTGDVLSEVHQNRLTVSLENMAFILGKHFLEGRCLSPPTNLVKLQLNLAEVDDITLNPLYDLYLQEIFDKYSYNTSGVNETGVIMLLQDVNLYVKEAVNLTSTTASRQKRSTKTQKSLFRSLHPRRSRRSSDTPSNFDINQCLDSASLMSVFDSDGEGLLNNTEFLQLCSYIVYQISNGNKCQEEVTSNDYNRAEVYGYGTLAVFIISACSILGFIIIPLMPENIYEIMMTSFIALAFGTLTGDALLHMLPESLVGDGNEDDGTQAFYKSLVITFSIYLLFLFEGFTHLLVKDTHQHSHEDQHGHSHTHNHEFVKKHTHMHTSVTINDKANGMEIVSVPSSEMIMENDSEIKQDLEEKPPSDDENPKNLQELILSEDQTPVCLGLTSLALVIIIGDAIHNVTDGISIGASFASDLKTGFSTALAVFFHELPHEFGDFVILLTTGLSMKKALIWNLISSLTAFMGLYIGIAVGENDEADKWIFAVTTGMFLYVAIADMLPEMKNIKSKRPWLAFLAQNIGALFGIGFMIFMHYLEDLIHF